MIGHHRQICTEALCSWSPGAALILGGQMEVEEAMFAEKRAATKAQGGCAVSAVLGRGLANTKATLAQPGQSTSPSVCTCTDISRSLECGDGAFSTKLSLHKMRPRLLSGSCTSSIFIAVNILCLCLPISGTQVCSECRSLDLQEAAGKFALHLPHQQ